MGEEEEEEGERKFIHSFAVRLALASAAR